MQRLQSIVFIHFDGNTKPLQLRKGEAEAFLRLLQNNSLTIYTTDSEVEKDRDIDSAFQPTTPDV